jgi:hypothetical protein
MPPEQPAPSPIVPVTSSPKGSRFSLGKITIVLLAIATLAFGGLSIYYINKYSKEKTTVDAQEAEAAAKARAEQKQTDDKDNAEAQKTPYRSYTAPAVVGAIKVDFPKSWNVYAEESQEAALLKLFMNPEVVRSEKNYDGGYAFRLSLERKLYTDSVKSMQKLIEKGEVKAQPITVSGIAGTRFTGKVTPAHNGAMVMIPLRDKTLTTWTESNDFVNDFNTILERISVVP